MDCSPGPSGCGRLAVAGARLDLPQRRGHRLREGPALGPGAGAPGRDAAAPSGGERLHLRRPGQRLRREEGRGGGGLGLRPRAAGCHGVGGGRGAHGDPLQRGRQRVRGRPSVGAGRGAGQEPPCEAPPATGFP